MKTVNIQSQRGEKAGMTIQRVCLMSALLTFWLACGMAHAAIINQPPPAQYAWGLQVAAGNQAGATLSGSGPGEAHLACKPDDVFDTTACVTLDIDTLPVMSLSASLWAYPIDLSGGTPGLHLHPALRGSDLFLRGAGSAQRASDSAGTEYG